MMFSEDGPLPAPCLSSSAAELVTDWEVVSTTSSRGSGEQKKGTIQDIKETARRSGRGPGSCTAPTTNPRRPLL